MIEKKYMTASEYFRNEIPLRVKIYMNEFNKSKLVLKELDKRFIDREELREKIHNILMEHKSNDWSDFSYIWDRVDEEILKLLEK